jgi:hypothetical protein
VVCELVEERGDGGGVGEDGAPIPEGEGGGEDDGLSLVATVDDLVEQICLASLDVEGRQNALGRESQLS